MGEQPETYHRHLAFDALRRDVHLQSVNLRILRIPKVQNLIQKLVDQDEIVLDRLLVQFAKVRPADLDKAIQELEDQCRGRVTPGIRRLDIRRILSCSLGHPHQVHVVDPDMEERR